MSTETIHVHCVGSRLSGYRLVDGPRMCEMCGRWFGAFDMIPDHDRPDIIAMINRGDYDT